MVAEIKMPALSPTMTEGKIISWNKNKGDKISIGEVILEVETDKAIMEVEAQEKGIIGDILFKENDNVKVGETIALILQKGETEENLKNYITNSANIEKKEIDNIKNNIQNENNTFNKINQSENNIKSFASPLAKNIAKMNNIDINLITNGSGPNGRIIKEDVERFIKNNQNNNSINYARNDNEYIDIEPTGMRKTIANRLTESKQQIPHWYLKISVNMDNILKLKNELNENNTNKSIKISINDIIVFIVAKTLNKNQDINVSWINGKIRKYNNIDISVACAVEDGILTPIVKNADKLNLFDLSLKIKELVKKAKEGKLQLNEYNGGSITISNLGMYDVEEFTSIINPPQSCIIAVGTITNKVVVNDTRNIEIKPICNITLSADHRVIDGEKLAKFSKNIKKNLENPALLIA